MRLTRGVFLTGISTASTLASASLVSAAEAPARLRRRNCFLGFHFDLHPQKTDDALGRDVTEEMIASLLERTKPDFIQYDCKGHAGYLGYPSKIGPSAPGIVKDSLALWRKATTARGVALYVHYSGVWDNLAASMNPGWAFVGPNGRPDPQVLSTFGPYVDEIMLPQLREAATKYELDGVWVDGDWWATPPDYSAAAAKAFGAPLPTGPGQARWQEFLDFNRAAFREYVRQYVDELHRTHPHLQIASNWLYTTYVPERPTLAVDFLSADYLVNTSIGAARLETRYLAATDRPWDLMAWGFQPQPEADAGVTHKTAVQVMQEASVTLMQGGAFQVYYQPTRSGYFDESLIETMGQIADFVRPRQDTCHGGQIVPQAAMLFSGHSLYRTSSGLFGAWYAPLTAPVRGLLTAMVESHIPVDILPDWKLEEAFRFGLVIVPDWQDIGRGACDRLRAYVEQGGRLLIAGLQNAAYFADLLGAEPVGDPEEEVAFIRGAGGPGTLRGVWQTVRPGNQTMVLAERFSTQDLRPGRGVPAATMASCGRGRIACIWGPAGAAYAQTHSAAARDWLAGIARRLWQPDLETTAPSSVEMALKQKDERLILHMANLTGIQSAPDYLNRDAVPVVGPFRVSLRLSAAPRRVLQQPEGRPVEGEYAEGVWRGVVRSLHIHSALVFER